MFGSQTKTLCPLYVVKAVYWVLCQQFGLKSKVY